MQAVFFYLYAAIAVAGGIGLVAARKLVHAMMSLFASLIAVAALFLVIGSEFIAAMQLFVYGGAVTVLVLFVLMLTRQGALQQAEEERPTKPLVRWLGLAASVALLGALVVTFLRTSWPAPSAPAPDTAAIASVLFSRFVLPFEVAGLILTVALIGAIVLAREDDVRDLAENHTDTEAVRQTTMTAVSADEAGELA
jgi:NADH-quinone oxidoreductase subunit J